MKPLLTVMSSLASSFWLLEVVRRSMRDRFKVLKVIQVQPGLLVRQEQD
jgi:hypothetical protein